MKPMSPQAKQMLAQYRRARALSPAERARALSALQERIGLGAAGSDPGVDAAPAPAPGPTRTQGIPRWAAKVVLGGVVSGALLWGALSRPAPRAHEPAAPRPRAPSAMSTPLATESDIKPPARLEPAPAASTPPAAAARARRSASRGRALERAGAAAAGQLPGTSGARAGEAAATPALVPEVPSAREEPRELTPQSQHPAALVIGDSTPSEPSTSRVRLPDPPQPAVEASLPPPRLDDEVKQLREAYDRLRDGEPLRALSALSEHARRFPDGKLVPMRKVARMLALCALGKLDQARQEAELFLEQHTNSAYAGRVRRICDESSASLPKID